MEVDAMKKQGRICKKKKTKNHIFLEVDGNAIFQLTIQIDNQSFPLLGIGDIIEAQVVCDDKSTPYKPKYESYLVQEIKVLSKRTETKMPIKLTRDDVKTYSLAKNRVRDYLAQKQYIEVSIPVLTTGETSSKAHSFITKHRKLDKKLYLRKTMDSFLRIYSCNDFNKIYAIGPCFRNEFITSMCSSEFEMLSVFSNYISMDEAVKLSFEIIGCILGEQIQYIKMTEKEYAELKKREQFILIDQIRSTVNSFAEIREDGFSNEYKIKYKGITIAHVIKEISSISSYKERIIIQGKKDNYGELELLENALKSGAPPCVNIGLSIIRTIAIYNGKRIKDYNPFSMHRLT